MRLNKSFIILIVLVVLVIASLIWGKFKSSSQSTGVSNVSIDYSTNTAPQSNIANSSASDLSNEETDSTSSVSESTSEITSSTTDTGKTDSSSPLQNGVEGDPSLFTVQNDDIVSTAVMYYVSGLQDDAILSVIDDNLLSKQEKLLTTEPYSTLSANKGNLTARKQGDVVIVTSDDKDYKFRVRLNDDVTQIKSIKYLGGN